MLADCLTKATGRIILQESNHITEEEVLESTYMDIDRFDVYDLFIGNSRSINRLTKKKDHPYLTYLSRSPVLTVLTPGSGPFAVVSSGDRLTDD